MKEADGLFSIAIEDLDSARVLAPLQRRQAAFHLQQAVEKIARAVLSIEGAPAPRTHGIGALAAVLPEAHAMRPVIAWFDRFSVYATQLRYPAADGEFPPPPELSDLAQGLNEANDFLAEFMAWRAQKP